MESDDYMSLLILEGKIKELREKGILNQDEIKLLVLVSNYKSFSQVSKEIGITRQVVSTKFNKITKKLAYYLGNYYTDLGYINYIARKYKFEEAQINKLMKFVLEN
jgi:DNA-binding CsgD family transcriptional regulator